MKGEFGTKHSVSTTFTIQSGEVPPVNTKYKFELSVKDSDNVSKDTIEVLVSGIEDWDLMSDTGFALDDTSLTFTDMEND